MKLEFFVSKSAISYPNFRLLGAKSPYPVIVEPKSIWVIEPAFTVWNGLEYIAVLVLISALIAMVFLFSSVLVGV